MSALNYEGETTVRLTPRKRLFVDPKVQGALLVRAVAYWCFYVLVIVELLLCWNIAVGPEGSFFSQFRMDQIWQQHGIVLIASLLVLPVVLYDVLRVSNRFVGPIYRMRRTLRSLAAGEYVGKLQFRKGDYRLELADEINAVADYIESLKRRCNVIEGALPALDESEREAIGHL